MAYVSNNEVNVKLVYDGPADVGIDENIHYIYERTPAVARSTLRHERTPSGALISFDFVPLASSVPGKFTTRVHLYYALAGTAPMAAERPLLLKGVDGLIFVADANKARLKENIATFDDLKDALATQGYALSKVPLTIQLNRANTEGALTAAELRAALKLGAEVPILPANSSFGQGVFDALKSSLKQVLAELKPRAAE